MWVFTKQFNLGMNKEIDNICRRHLSEDERNRIIAFRYFGTKERNQSQSFFFHLFDPVSLPPRHDQLSLHDTKFHGVFRLPKVGYVFMNSELYQQNVDAFSYLEKRYAEKRQLEQAKKAEGDI